VLFFYLDKRKMAATIIFLLILFSPMVISDSDDDDSINLLVHSSPNSTIHRYCVEVAKLPDGHTVNISSFGWHSPFIASPYVNACDIDDLEHYLPHTFPTNTILILYEHKCKMTVHAWNVEYLFGHEISLMILTNRTNTNYELSYNTTGMPVSIPVLIFAQKDFDKINKLYDNIHDIELSINYAPIVPRKFRPAILLVFLLVFFILVCGNFWAADEFVRKIKNRNIDTHGESPSVNTTPISNNDRESTPNTPHNEITIPKPNTHRENQTPKNNEPAIIYMPYCIIALILCFAVGWLLLIYYFPKVMIYILQGNV
jgi:hypothetical protein